MDKIHSQSQIRYSFHLDFKVYFFYFLVPVLDMREKLIKNG
jgi:hypothetical protein